jgi:magnesium transporter
MSFFTKGYHEPGTPPGTLRAGTEVAGGETVARLCVIGPSACREQRLHAAEPWGKAHAEGEIAWLHLQGPLSTALMERIETDYGLHALALEDVINTGHRAKYELYDDKLFMVLVLPVLSNNELTLQQVSLFHWDDQIVSFCSGSTDPFAPVRTRLHGNPARFAKLGADYVFYLLIDMVVDQSFPVLEYYSSCLEDMEERVIDFAEQDALKELHVIKRELMGLRRALWPQRDVLGELSRGRVENLSDNTQIYLRDCYDHSLHIMDMLETAREMLLSLHDLYLSSISHRLNEVMRILTVIATIFIPLTFITGIYGMNFETGPDRPWSMPELAWRYGYLLALGIMVVVALAMVAYFKRKKWL